MSDVAAVVAPIIVLGLAGCVGAYYLTDCCQNKSSKLKRVDFKLHIAIDFGTSGCGLAFAYQGEVDAYDKFRAGGRRRTNKTRTCILLNDKNEVQAFGESATDIYKMTSPDITRLWKYFERFKMELYDRQGLNVEIKKTLKATNGMPMPSETVFVKAFQRINALAQEYLPKVLKNDETPKKEEIQWILTVPAIWSDKSKNMMKEWIIKAGLVQPNIENQCVVVYEPDCASLAIQKQYFDTNKEGQNKFKEGDKYILVDAGGGTVDIACHQITASGDVEEISHPSGGAWGGCYIDDLYMQLLEQIFSKDWMKEFKKRNASQYLNIKAHFQDAKKRFYKNTEAQTHIVQIPFEFAQFIEEKCGNETTPESIVQQFKKSLAYYHHLFFDKDDIFMDTEAKTDEKEEIGIEWKSVEKGKFERNSSDEFLVMDVKIWMAIFDAKISPIIAHVDTLYREKLKGKCDYLCLVGGSAGSEYFQARMRAHFGKDSKYGLTVIIPDSPILAVVRGAAWMGHNKGYIKARSLKYTYGINKYFSVQTATESRISQGHIDENKTADGYVDNCFHIIASKNQRVSLEDKPIKYTVRAAGTTTSLPILCSDQPKPLVASDGRELGEITLEGTVPGEELVVEFHFQGTMLVVFAYPKNNPKSRKQCEVKYEK